MNCLPEEAKTLLKAVVGASAQVADVTTMVAPPAPLLSLAWEECKNSRVLVGAQNCHWEAAGAFTGELSSTLLKSVGCSFVIVGHSERRIQAKETDEEVASRLMGAIKGGLTPILCVGETEHERDHGKTLTVLVRQLHACLTDEVMGIVAQNLTQPIPPLMVAYEPVWAIGSGKAASPAEISETHQWIASYLEDRATTTAEARNPAAGSPRIPLLYGGSVSPKNFDMIARIPAVDGALVGGASLKADTFTPLMKSAMTAMQERKSLQQ